MLRTVEPRPWRRRRFAITFLLFLASLTLWALATPMFGAADETQHMLTSYAMVHGQGRGKVDPTTGGRIFHAPHEFPPLGPCWTLSPQAPASCEMPGYTGTSQEIVSSTTTYPPFYYLAVGWPTLLTSGRLSLYLMRWVSAIFVALMLALALDTLACVDSPGPLMLGLSVALVPVAFFFGASVNPSGLAIAASLAAWTGGILLTRGEPVIEVSAVARFAGPLCVMLLLRRDSFYWAGLIVVALVALSPWSRARLLARRRAVWVGAGAVGLSALVSLLSGGASASAQGGPIHGGDFWRSVGLIEVYLRQLVGILGWIDTYLPYPVYLLIQALVAFLVIAAWCFGSRRLALVTAGIAAVVVLVPVVIGSIDLGYFQGRYEVGFAAGLPLVAALAIGEKMEARSLTWPKRPQVIGLALLAFVMFASFAQSLRRFSAGADGQWWIFATPKWTPPYGSLTLLTLLFVIATAGLYAWIFLQSWPGLQNWPWVEGDRRRPASLGDFRADQFLATSVAGPDPDEEIVQAELERWGLKGPEGPEGSEGSEGDEPVT